MFSIMAKKVKTVVREKLRHMTMWGSVLIDFSLTVKAATLIFIYGRDLAISSYKEGKSGSIYNLVKNK